MTFERHTEDLSARLVCDIDDGSPGVWLSIHLKRLQELRSQLRYCGAILLLHHLSRIRKLHDSRRRQRKRQHTRCRQPVLLGPCIALEIPRQTRRWKIRIRWVSIVNMIMGMYIRTRFLRLVSQFLSQFCLGLLLFGGGSLLSPSSDDHDIDFPLRRAWIGREDD